MDLSIVEIIAAFLVGAVIAVICVYLVVVRKKEGEIQKLEIENSALEKEMEVRAEYAKIAEKRFSEQMENMKLTFEKSASEVFEKRSKALGEANEIGMKNIIDPLREQMDHFRKAVEEARKESGENSAVIKENIKNLMESSLSLGTEAQNLANALRGNSKIQGNWGENHLVNILETAGLREGEDFDTQVLIRDCAGNAMRNDESDRKLIADVVVRFPDDKCVIIDSKVSLDGYLEYMSANSDEERSVADRKHLESVKKHIVELSDKDYAKYMKKSQKDALQYMIMYIPVEGAFQLFFQNHQDEWHKAYDKQIIITSDLYVLTMLKVIQMAWGEYKRNKNYDRILESSRILLDRVRGFEDSFDEVGKGIEKMQRAFSDARRRLHEGPRSVDAIYAKITEMGVQSKKVIDASATDAEREESI